MGNLRIARRVVVVAIVAILFLTALEFPPPIGFETRPQDNVSYFWLAFFLVILIVELATLVTIYWRPNVGGTLGILAGILNILQVIADQTHMMQPEVAPFGYLVLEDMVVLASLVLVYFSWRIVSGAATNARASG
jgi:hypothetical protein